MVVDAFNDDDDELNARESCLWHLYFSCSTKTYGLTQAVQSIAMVYLNNGYGTSLKSHVAHHKLCHKIVFGEHVTKMQQNLEVQCERCTNTFVTKCTCLQVSKGSTKTTRAAQGKRHMSPNGSVKVSTNLFYAQAECWDLSRGSIWCNWKVCENQAKKNNICLEITAKCM